MAEQIETSPVWLEPEIEDPVEVLLDEISKQVPISIGVQRLMHLTQDVNVDISRIVEVLEQDPTLASETMRLANSAFFGQSRQITTLQRAVIVLGMSELHNAARALALSAKFKSQHRITEHLQETGVLAASLSRSLAEKITGIDYYGEAEAFLAGLLCEIGSLACAAIDTDGYVELWEATRGNYDARRNLEVERYSTSCEIIGAELLDRHQISEVICNAVSGRVVDSEGSLGTIVSFARRAIYFMISHFSIPQHEESERELAEGLITLKTDLRLMEVEDDLVLALCREHADYVRLKIRSGQLLRQRLVT